MTDALAAMAARLREVPTLGAEIAKEVRPDLLALAKATANAGTTPDGTPWAPTKRGKRALVNAANAITAEVVGDVVYLVIRGINVFQNATRRIIPYRGKDLPPAYGDAVRAAAARVLARTP